VHKEYMIHKLYKKEQYNAKLILAQSKITLIASNMELFLMVVEVLVWKELLCFIVHLRISEIVLFSLEILKELPLDLSIVKNINYLIA
jgi:hypothetical protein